MTDLLAATEAVFRWLLETSWQASVLALVVLALQWILRARLHARWSYALWLLVLLRLVMPALPASALSLFRWTPAPPPFWVVLTASPTEPEPVALAPAPAVTSAAAPSLSLFSILALIWLTGATGLAVLTWSVNRRFVRQVGLSPSVIDPALLALFSEARVKMGIHRPLRLIENRQVKSPALMGLFRPVLLLPADTRSRFSDVELRFIFLHEMAHLKRGDLIVQWLIALLQILHWFNPVLWFAFRRMRHDREPATDALVLSRTGEGEKERYGLMLIKLLEHFQQRHSIATLVGILEDTGQFQRRVSLIARFTQGTYGWSLLGVLLITILGVAGLTKSKAVEPLPATYSTQPSAEISKKTPPGFIRIGAKVLQISDADYQAHRTEIDAAVQRGDVAPLSRLPSFDLLSEPSMLVRWGEKATMEAIRVFPYPIRYEKDKSGKMTPTDFARRNLGITLPLFSDIQNGKVVVTGSLEVTKMQGWIPSADKTQEPIFNTCRIPIAVKLASGQTIALSDPGIQADFSALEELASDPSDTHQPQRSDVPHRLFLFLNVKTQRTDYSAPSLIPSPTVSVTPTPAPVVMSQGSYPAGIIIPTKPGFVRSPYATYAEPVDVRGYPPGTAIRCPYTNKIFTVPEAENPLKPLPPLPSGSTQVELELKVAQIDENVYQVNRQTIDADIEKGSPDLIELINHLPGCDLLAAPSVTTQVGLKADLDIVREFPYPTRFDAPKLVTQQYQDKGRNVTVNVATLPTPREFATQNIGVDAEIMPSLDQNNIIVTGQLKIIAFEGFTKSDWAGQVINEPLFRTDETNLLQVLRDKEMKCLWLPGWSYNDEIMMNKPAFGQTATFVRSTKKRRLLFITAREIR